MTIFPRVLVDQAHSCAWSLDRREAALMNPANPGDASYAMAADQLRVRGFEVGAHQDGPIEAAVLDGIDVLVLAHPARTGSERTTGHGTPVLGADELDAIEAYVLGGGGLLVLAECDQATYGNNLTELLGRFGVGVISTTVQESADGAHRFRGVPTWVLAEPGEQAGQGILAGVRQMCFYRAGALDLSGAPQAQVVARTSGTADPANAPLAAVLSVGEGRLGVLADSDLFGADSLGDLDHATLWQNLVTWVAGPGTSAPSQTGRGLDQRWHDLKGTVAQLREMQSTDGSIEGAQHELSTARTLLDTLVGQVGAISGRYPHDADYLTALRADLTRWANEGFGVPDFLDSLVAFRPDQHRVDGIEHLVLFPMYTQNGNPNRQLEALIVRVMWPQFLAEVEQRYDNSMFLPVQFVDFTAGYDTNSAVLFPETVAMREVPRFHWGAIFCDREGARFRTVVSAASELLGATLPPEAERLVARQDLAQNTFAMWDLIHDRTHSHGDLPFDPFMIKQRMPYWMYALEELRCDLNTFRQAVALAGEGHPYARSVQYAIVFDRLFRFPITGERVRNYDGLGGQLLFAYLHRNQVLQWTDNTLRMDWVRLPGAVVDLCELVEKLYREGIDRSRTAHWLAAYELMASYVAPHPASVWAKGIQALPLDGPAKGLVDAVLPDEFPLNVFYEALRKKMKPVIDSTRGITA